MSNDNIQQLAELPLDALFAVGTDILMAAATKVGAEAAMHADDPRASAVMPDAERLHNKLVTEMDGCNVATNLIAHCLATCAAIEFCLHAEANQSTQENAEQDPGDDARAVAEGDKMLRDLFGYDDDQGEGGADDN